MSYILGFDGSQFQGTNISFPQVKAAGYLFGLTRMTYAYPGQSIKIDPTAGKNYYGMVSAGILPGGYHKIGWTDPIAEADAFVNAMSPLSPGDLLGHDMEPSTDAPIPANWSDFEQKYVQRVFDRTGVWSIRYENISMNNNMPKQGCVVNCPSWVAAPSFGWDATVPVSTPVIIQQGPAVHIPGITANVCDTDAFFGNGTPDELLAELRKLAYHALQAAPAPPVVTPPQEVPVAPIQTPTPPVAVTPPAQVSPPQPPISEPRPPQVITVGTHTSGTAINPPQEAPVKEAPRVSFWQELVALIRRFLHG